MTEPEFQITDHLRAWGKAHGYNVDMHYDFFMNYIANRDRKPYKDIGRAFMNAVIADWGSIRFRALKAGNYWPQQKVARKDGMEWVPGENGEMGKWVRTA